MKKTKLAIIFSIFISTQSFSDGIPTIDVAAIGQIVVQIQELQKQYEQMLKDYEQYKQMNENMMGVSGLGNILNEDKLTDLLPDFKAEIETIINNGISSLEGKAREILESQKLDYRCQFLTNSEKTICEKNAGLLAVQQASYSQSLEIIEQRRNNINKLLNEASNAKTQKQISDLQVRVQGEVAFLQAQQIKADMTKNYIAQQKAALEVQQKEVIDNLFRVSDSSQLQKAFE